MADPQAQPDSQQADQNPSQSGIQALNPLVDKVRSKYPGVYDDMDDATLTKKLLAKYPQYSDLAAPPVPDPKATMPMREMAQQSLIGGRTNYMIGGEPIQSMGQQAQDMAQGMATDAKQLSTPGVAATILKKQYPEYSSKIEALMNMKAASPNELVNKAAATILPMAAMGMDSPSPQPQAQSRIPPAPAETATATPVKIGTFAKDASSTPYSGSRVPSQMNLVDSTNITKMGYHPESKTMMIEYRNGRVYEYRGVPKEVFQGAQDSESTGSFVARNVRGRYETNFRGSVLGKK